MAVFLAYNANSGLPFVPTYDLKAELPTGSKLVKGNDVRVGGFRVGFVERLRPGASDSGKAVAIVDMKLDKQIEPLARDTTARVRPRSPLGIKFVELTPGSSDETFAAGDTIGLAEHLRVAGVRGRLRRLPARRRARTCAGRRRGSATRSPGAASR